MNEKNREDTGLVRLWSRNGQLASSSITEVCVSLSVQVCVIAQRYSLTQHTHTHTGLRLNPTEATGTYLSHKWCEGEWGVASPEHRCVFT